MKKFKNKDLFKASTHLVKSAESGPMNRGVNKNPASIPGPQQPWRAGIFSSYSLISRPYFRIAAFGIESRSLVTSCEPTLNEKISKSWFYQTFTTSFGFVFYIATWVLYFTLILKMFGYMNLSDKYIFNNLFGFLGSLLPFITQDSRVRLLGLLCCFIMGFANLVTFTEICFNYDLYKEAAPFSYSNYVLPGGLVTFLYDLFISTKLHLSASADEDDVKRGALTFSPLTEKFIQVSLGVGICIELTFASLVVYGFYQYGYEGFFHFIKKQFSRFSFNSKITLTFDRVILLMLVISSYLTSAILLPLQRSVISNGKVLDIIIAYMQQNSS